MTRFNAGFAAAGAAPRRHVVAHAVLGLAMIWLGTAAIADAKARCLAGDPRVLAQTSGGRIAFGDRTRVVMLTPACGALGTAVRRAEAKARFLLVVEDLRASSLPGAIFDITLAPFHARADRRRRMLGALNFFNAHPAAAGKGRSVSYDVTAQVKALARRDRLPRGIALALAPMSMPERTSDASAGAIKLVVQAD